MRLLLTLFALAGTIATAQGPVDNVAFWQLHVSEYNAIQKAEELVIRDDLEFSAFWRRLWGNSDRAPKVPYVDFKKEAVIVIAMGQRSSGGHGIRGILIQRTEGTLSVVYIAFSPGPGCVTTQAGTSPVVLLRFELPAPKPRFVAQHSLTYCGKATRE